MVKELAKNDGNVDSLGTGIPQGHSHIFFSTNIFSSNFLFVYFEHFIFIFLSWIFLNHEL